VRIRAAPVQFAKRFRQGNNRRREILLWRWRWGQVSHAAGEIVTTSDCSQWAEEHNLWHDAQDETQRKKSATRMVLGQLTAIH
jgi:hypothetical protein